MGTADTHNLDQFNNYGTTTLIKTYIIKYYITTQLVCQKTIPKHIFIKENKANICKIQYIQYLKVT
jgi:hypothetical protein